VTPEAFEAIVEEALAELPPELGTHMDNVVIVVEDEPAAEDGHVLGIYCGIDLTRRDSSYVFQMPDQIVIFQGPIERLCGDDEDAIADEVYVTVLHEIAHHFGISDDRLHELGWD